jgi:hypothetical protein
MASIEDLTQDDIDKMEKALDRYKKENEKFRTERDEFKSLADNNEANKALRDRALKAEAKAKLTEQGVKDVDRFVKRLNFDSVSLDEEGNLSGLDEQIDGFKADFPEVFDAKRRVGGQIDSGPRNPTETTKSTTERQLDSLPFFNR